MVLLPLATRHALFLAGESATETEGCKMKDESIAVPKARDVARRDLMKAGVGVVESPSCPRCCGPDFHTRGISASEKRPSAPSVLRETGPTRRKIGSLEDNELCGCHCRSARWREYPRGSQ
jgi:hypothetical protein